MNALFITEKAQADGDEGAEEDSTIATIHGILDGTSPWGYKSVTTPTAPSAHRPPPPVNAMKSPSKISMLILLGAACTSAPSPSDGDEGTDEPEWECVASEENPPYLQQLGCEDDFDIVAAEPMDASIPGAVSVKTVVDRSDGDALYFQNSNEYKIHWEFVSAHLSGNGLPIVPPLSSFNETEYYSPQRRFLLGSVTRYEGPGVWAYEISPYDTASAELIELAYQKIVENSYFGEELYFHPTSEAVEREAENLGEGVKVITTDELFAGIDYQPLNLAASMGRLRFIRAEDLETEYVTFRDIVVIDRVPNDISVVLGIITGQFQTPLSHINVLSQNRGTPNMALRNAFQNEELRALDGKWVELDVNAFDYSIREVTQDEADSWWEDNAPAEVQVPTLDTTVAELRDIELLVDLTQPLKEAIKVSIPAYGGKASHYGALAQIEDVPVPKAFAIPVHYYWQFMTDNGFFDRIDAMLVDESFRDDPAVRDQMLEELRNDMLVAPIDPEFEAALIAKLEAEYPDTRMRFRSSTNAEDLEGFTGAGLYTSKSAEVDDPEAPVMDAVREVWSSIWFFRAFEEREYRRIDHNAVGMALLVHHSFPQEEANGVALTANPFDTSGLEPGFYVNVQYGEASVVLPGAGITSDQFIHYYDLPGQPVVYIEHSNLTPDGGNVLTSAQTNELGSALSKIHKFYAEAYGPGAANPGAWYAMDVEFKFDGEEGETPTLHVKQARPHPGRGQ